MASTLNAFRNGAVGFIDWLGPILFEPNFSLVSSADVKRLVDNAINHDDLVTPLAAHAWGH